MLGDRVRERRGGEENEKKKKKKKRKDGLSGGHGFNPEERGQKIVGP